MLPDPVFADQSLDPGDGRTGAWGAPKPKATVGLRERWNLSAQLQALQAHGAQAQSVTLYHIQAGTERSTDADTVLGVTPEAIAAELAAQSSGAKKPTGPIMLQRVDRMPPGNITWTVSGLVAVR